MFGRLDEVDWSSLRHAYGEASDVPDLIRSLAAPDRKTREDALYELYGTGTSGTRGQSMRPPRRPFLFSSSCSNTLNFPSGTTSSPFFENSPPATHDVHGDLDWFRNERNTPEFKEKVECELGWVKAAHEAVVDGLDLYLSLAEDEDD